MKKIIVGKIWKKKINAVEQGISPVSLSISLLLTTSPFPQITIIYGCIQSDAFSYVSSNITAQKLNFARI